MIVLKLIKRIGNIATFERIKIVVKKMTSIKVFFFFF